MTSRTVEHSPQIYTRLGGALYLIIIFAGLFSELLVRAKLIVFGSASATANNIMASQLLWRLGIASDLIMHVCDIPLMLILYLLLRAINKKLALLAMLFTLIQTYVLVTTKLNLFMPLFLSGNADYMKAFEPNQINALIYLSIKYDLNGLNIGLIFFGFSCLLIGYLIYKSTYFPKVLGIMMQIAGFCYLSNSFVQLLSPAFADIISPAILIPSFFGELSFCLWLLVKGVNGSKWEEKISTAT